LLFPQTGQMASDLPVDVGSGLPMCRTTGNRQRQLGPKIFAV
jgi:hypothetical protein